MNNVIKSSLCILSVFAFAIIPFTAMAMDVAVIDWKKKIYIRPANFYKIEKSSDNKTCQQILEKINESYTDAVDSTDPYFGTLTNNSSMLQFQARNSESTSVHIFTLRYDIDGDGKNEWIYKFYSHLYDRYIASLYISKLEIGDNTLSDYDMYFKLLRYPSITFGDKVYTKDAGFSRVLSPNIGLLHMDKKLMVLSGESSSPHLFCNKKYNIYAFDINAQEGESPICKFISKKKVQCNK